MASRYRPVLSFRLPHTGQPAIQKFLKGEKLSYLGGGLNCAKLLNVLGEA